MTRRRRLAIAAILVGLAWRFWGSDGVEHLSWLAGIVACVLAWEAAEIVRTRAVPPQSPTADLSRDTDAPEKAVAAVAPLSPPVPVAPVQRTDDPGRSSRAKDIAETALGLAALASLVAMFTWVATYDGPRGTQEVTCAVGICYAR